jgi:hypothetical protein
MHVDPGCPTLDVLDHVSLMEVKPMLFELCPRGIGTDRACEPIVLRLRYAIRPIVA